MRWIWLFVALAGCVDFDAGTLPDPANDTGSGSGSGSGVGSGSGSGAPAAMTQVLVATAVFAPSATAYNIPITSTVDGATLIIGVALDDPNQRVSGISDNKGSEYKSAQARASWTSGATEVWYAQARSAGVNNLSFSLSGATASSLWVIEVTGLAAAQPWQATIDNMSAGPQMKAPPVTTDQANAFVVSVVNVQSGALQGIDTASTFQDLPARNGDDAAYTVSPTPGAYAATWDTSTSGACASTAAFAAM